MFCQPTATKPSPKRHSPPHRGWRRHKWSRGGGGGGGGRGGGTEAQAEPLVQAEVPTCVDAAAGGGGSCSTGGRGAALLRRRLSTLRHIAAAHCCRPALRALFPWRCHLCRQKKKIGPQAAIDGKRDTMHRAITTLAKQAGVVLHPDDDDA